MVLAGLHRCERVVDIVENVRHAAPGVAKDLPGHEPN